MLFTNIGDILCKIYDEVYDRYYNAYSMPQEIQVSKLMYYSIMKHHLSHGGSYVYNSTMFGIKFTMDDDLEENVIKIIYTKQSKMLENGLVHDYTISKYIKVDCKKKRISN